MRYDIRYFRILAAIEGSSLLFLLGIAVPVKRILGDPSLVRSVGLVHGVLFLMYLYTLVTLTLDHKWTAKKFMIAFLASSIPFGTFWFDRKYLA